jgi:hypothetical protein
VVEQAGLGSGGSDLVRNSRSKESLISNSANICTDARIPSQQVDAQKMSLAARTLDVQFRSMCFKS